MHYFDNMSCDEIGHILGKSSGTVKWWLHDARIAIEKGMNIMREYGEKSYRPGKLFMSCTGNPENNDEPMTCSKKEIRAEYTFSSIQRAFDYNRIV